MSEPPTVLPPVMARIAEAAGLEAAWALARAKGGQRLFLPRHAGKRHWLTRIVGQEAANAICRHFRGEHIDTIEVPMASAIQRAERWRDILAQDLSANEAAEVAGVHRRTVFRHRAKARNSGQGDLF